MVGAVCGRGHSPHCVQKAGAMGSELLMVGLSLLLQYTEPPLCYMVLSISGQVLPTGCSTCQSSLATLLRTL